MNNEKFYERYLKIKAESMKYIDDGLRNTTTLIEFFNYMRNLYNIHVHTSSSDIYYNLNYLNGLSMTIKGSKLGRGYDLASIYYRYGYEYSINFKNGKTKYALTYLPEYPQMVFPI